MLRYRPSFYLFLFVFLFFSFPSLRFFFFFFLLPIRPYRIDTHTYTLGEIGTRLFGHASCRNVYVISGCAYPSPIRRPARAAHPSPARDCLIIKIMRIFIYISCPRDPRLAPPARAPNAETELQRASGFSWPLIQRRFNRYLYTLATDDRGLSWVPCGLQSFDFTIIYREYRRRAWKTPPVRRRRSRNARAKVN